MSNDNRYSEFAPMQELGETIAMLGQAGPTRRSRWLGVVVGAFAIAAVAISPAGAAIADAVDSLIGGEPTTESLVLGDLPGKHEPSEKWQRFFDQERASQIVLADGNTPLGTPYELVLDPVATTGPITSCAFLGFDGADTGWRTTETCIGPTVSDGFKQTAVPIYPTIYRGPVESSEIPTPIVIGVAPSDVARVEITYLDESGRRIEAPSVSAQVTSSMLSSPRDTNSSRHSGTPAYASDPYLTFAAFLPSELDRNGPSARQPSINFEQIEITAFDGADNELYWMHMDGRFSGDPAIVSVG